MVYACYNRYMIRIFTDGSYVPQNGMGAYCAVIVNDAQASVSDSVCVAPGAVVTGTEQKTTSYRMELLAIVKAMEKIEDLYGSGTHEVEIYTDAQGIITSVNRYLQNGKKPQNSTDLWDQLIPLLKRHSVRFVFASNQHQEYR